MFKPFSFAYSKKSDSQGKLNIIDFSTINISLYNSIEVWISGNRVTKYDGKITEKKKIESILIKLV